MPRRSLTGSTLVTSSPLTVKVPDVGSIILLIIRIDVVLPQPDGPTKTARVPSATSRVRSSTATVPSGYCLVTPAKLIMPSSLSGLRASAHPPCLVFAQALIRPVWSSRKRSSALNRFVEAVVLHPFSCGVFRVDAGVSGCRGVEFDEVVSRQLGVDRVEHALELIGFLLRAHQRNDVGGQEVVLRVLEDHQVVLPDRR